MAAQRGYLYDVVLSTAGAPIPGVSVQVNVHSAGAATLFTTEAGGTTQGNPMTTDSAGSFNCWIPEGTYDLVLSGSGITTQTITRDVLKAINEPGFLLSSTGDMIYASSANALARLGIGATNQVLTVSGGIPAWGGSYASYTPTWTATGTAPAIGNSTVIAKYVQLGKMVHAFGSITFGSTATFGTGTYIFALPVTESSNANSIGNYGQALLSDVSTNNGIIASVYSQNTGVMRLIIEATYLGSEGGVTAVSPWTWAVGDSIAWNITYEAA